MLRRLASFVVRRSWVRKIALSTPGLRDIAWRFVAGETLETGLSAIRRLNARGIKGTLNCVGTHAHSEADAVAAADVAIESLRRIHEQGLESHVSIKLTQLGLDIDEELCRTQVRRVLDGACEVDGFVRIDMEESSYTDRTIGLFEEMREAYGPERVGIVLQSYLRNRQGDLERLAAGGSRIRLVKGGYWEPAEVVLRRKADIDRAFLRDIELLLARARKPALATHDTVAIDRACQIADRQGLDRGAFEFQMLYGVRPDLQDRLVREGYSVRCYVPYGGQWFEYVLGCVRRVPGGALKGLRERIRRRG